MILTFGFGGFGNLCNHTVSDQLTPEPSKSLVDVQAEKICVGLWHTLIITQSHKLFAVGRGRYGALGLGDHFTQDEFNSVQPREISYFSKNNIRVVDAAAGKTHSLAVTDSGQLYSWGLGNGKGHGLPTLEGEPCMVNALADQRIVQVSAGTHISACIDDQGHCYTWGGTDSRYPVRVETTEKKSQVSMLEVGEKFIKVATGEKHHVMLTDRGKLFGCGNNMHYQAMPIASSSSAQPTISRIAPIPCPEERETWRDMVCGLTFTMAITTGGKLYIWGLLNNGCSPFEATQLLSTPTKLPVPSNVQASSIKQIFGGCSSWGFLTVDGSVYVQGYNKHGNLGLGDRVNRSNFVRLEGVDSLFISHVYYGSYNGYLMVGSNAFQDYRHLRDHGYQSDVVIRSRSTTHRVHRCMLAMRSKKMATLLRELSVEDDGSSETSTVTTAAELNFEHVPDDVMAHALNFIYTNISVGAPPVTSDEGQKLLHVLTQEFGLDGESITVDASGLLSADVEQYASSIYQLSEQREQFYPDVTIVLDSGDRLMAHKCVLSARSDYFRAAFQSGLMESTKKELHFSEATVEAFTHLLDYIYTGRENVHVGSSVELLILATRIHFSRWKAKLEKTIIDNVAMDNAMELINVADICDSPGIKKHCISLLGEHFTEDDVFQEKLKEHCDAEVVEEIKLAAQLFKDRERKQEELRRAERERSLEERRYASRLVGDRGHRLANYGDNDARVVNNIIGNRRNRNQNTGNTGGNHQQQQQQQQRNDPCLLM